MAIVKLCSIVYLSYLWSSLGNHLFCHNDTILGTAFRSTKLSDCVLGRNYYIERDRGGLSSMWLIQLLVERKLFVSHQHTLAAMKLGDMWVHINGTAVRSKELISLKQSSSLFLGLRIKGKLQTGAHSLKNLQDGWEICFCPVRRGWENGAHSPWGRVESCQCLLRLARKHSQALHWDIW